MKKVLGILAITTTVFCTVAFFANLLDRKRYAELNIHDFATEPRQYTMH